MEIKIPKEVRQHSETIFFWPVHPAVHLCGAGCCGGHWHLLSDERDARQGETASWVCILAAAPLAATGFFRYNGLTLEQFAWAFIKSQVLCARPRVFPL